MHREDCPVCGNHVGYFRFLLPFGHCRHCGNYLAVRNWNRTRWGWALMLFGIGCTPVIARIFGVPASNIPVYTLLFMWYLASSINDKIFGQLVPAVRWGFIALTDDERIPRSPDSTSDIR